MEEIKMKMCFSENGYYLFNKKRLIQCLQKSWGITWKEFLKTGYGWDGADAVAEYFDSRHWNYMVVDPDGNLAF